MADDPAHPCGAGVPGHTGINVWRTLVNRVARLGGKIEYVAFDGSVAFGHYNINKQATACNYTIEELARNIAPQIELIKTAYPDVKFGDVEPVNGLTIGRIDDNLQFAKEFFRQTGVRLSFMHADIIWQEKTMHSQLVEWRRRLHEAGMEYGTIVNGNPPDIDKNDLQWTGHAIERYGLVTNDPAIKPDHYIFQSWGRNPARYLPETQPGTFTSVACRPWGEQNNRRPNLVRNFRNGPSCEEFQASRAAREFLSKRLLTNADTTTSVHQIAAEFLHRTSRQPWAKCRLHAVQHSCPLTLPADIAPHPVSIRARNKIHAAD